MFKGIHDHWIETDFFKDLRLKESRGNGAATATTPDISSLIDLGTVNDSNLINVGTPNDTGDSYFIPIEVMTFDYLPGETNALINDMEIIGFKEVFPIPYGKGRKDDYRRYLDNGSKYFRSCGDTDLLIGINVTQGTVTLFSAEDAFPGVDSFDANKPLGIAIDTIARRSVLKP